MLFRENDIIQAIDREIDKTKFRQDIEELITGLVKTAIADRQKNKGQEKNNIISRIGKLHKEQNKLLDLKLEGYDDTTIKGCMEENKKLIEILEHEKDKTGIDISNIVSNIQDVVKLLNHFRKHITLLMINI